MGLIQVSTTENGQDPNDDYDNADSSKEKSNNSVGDNIAVPYMDEENEDKSWTITTCRIMPYDVILSCTVLHFFMNIFLKSIPVNLLTCYYGIRQYGYISAKKDMAYPVPICTYQYYAYREFSQTSPKRQNIKSQAIRINFGISYEKDKKFYDWTP